jgi:hypothetical protein
MIFALRITRSQLYTQAVRNAYKSRPCFPAISQFHTAITQQQEGEYEKKGSVQYKLRGKVCVYAIRQEKIVLYINTKSFFFSFE